MRVEFGLLQLCSAVILVIATFVVKEVDSRLPPKLLKVASGASKALYARGYGYSVIPIPQKILLQTSVARREVHHPRPVRRAKRPRRGKRPPFAYAAKYQDYRPSRKRRPPPHNRDPEYAEPEQDDDFEYEDRPYKELEDLYGKQSDIYGEGYGPKSHRGRYNDEDGAYSESSGYYARRPRPTRSGRPSTKLYSAALAYPPTRYHKEENEYDEEDEDGYERENYSGRYTREEEEEDDDRYYLRDRYREWAPDDVYHDRKFQARQEKFRRAAEDKPKPKKGFRKPQQYRSKKTEGSTRDERPTVLKEVNHNKWKMQNERERFQNPYEKNRWKNLLQMEEQMKWKESVTEPVRTTRLEPIKTESIKLGDQGRWRNPSSLGIGQFFGKEPQAAAGEDWKEPEIITKQNAGKWEERQQYGQRNYDGEQAKRDADGWVKEHSVGYGIEIDGGGRKKKEHSEPDVVYGQSGYSKPRVPDLGYGQGMELVGDKVSGWQVYLR